MTPAQTKLHWNGRHGQPGWIGVAAANHWQMVKGRLREDAVKIGDCGDWHRTVWHHAAALARQEHRSVTAEDLRHGTYLAALGKVKSSKDFTNADLDRVLIWFRLLVNPEDLAAIRDWNEYEAFDKARNEMNMCARKLIPCSIDRLPDDPGERRRVLFFIRQVPEAVVAKICRDRFGTADPDDLCLSDLRQLNITLKNRRNYNDKPVHHQDTEATREEMPLPAWEDEGDPY